MNPSIIVTWPTDEERVVAFESYCLALGKVAHAWNYFHEILIGLFVVVSGIDLEVALAIWHAPQGERAQRAMIRHAAEAVAAMGRWPKTPLASQEIKWILDRADAIADKRNTIIHAPCSLYIGGGPQGTHEMGAAYFRGNPQAKKLSGKHVLAEFAWCEQATEVLSDYVPRVQAAISHPGEYLWPARPTWPARVA